MAKSTAQRLAKALVLVALAAFLASALAVGRYPGLARATWGEMRWASAGERRNFLAALPEWIGSLGRLARDPASGRYELPASAPGLDGFEQAQLAFHRGELARAAALLRRDIERRGETEEKLLWLGITYLEKAEVADGLPLLREPPRGRGAGRPVSTLPAARRCRDPASARAAAALFERLLNHYDPEDRLYRWLLTYTAMALGDLPRRVPARYRIGTPVIDLLTGVGRRRMEGRLAPLRFVDRARQLGVDTYDTGRGVAVEDFDGDGRLDIITGGSFDTLHYYRNRGPEGFADLTREAGLSGVRRPLIITAADYDGDGWMDLFVGRMFGRYVLFHNDGGGRFHDATAAAGLLAPLRPGQIPSTWVSAWSDVDGDGDLDLFLAQWALRFPFARGPLAAPRMDSALFLDEGGVFRERTAEYGIAGLVRDQVFLGAAFGDYDDDGFPDLFLSSPLWNTSVLLHNDGGRRFVPVEGIDALAPGFTAAFVDLDQDGRLDLFQGGAADARTSTEMAIFGEHLDRYRSAWSNLFLQQPDGRFARRPDLFVDPMPMATMGAAVGDLDNDGCPDLYLGTGDPEPWFLLPNLLYLGERRGERCTGRLLNASALPGFGTVQKGHGIVFFDADGDGDVDVYSSLGGMWPGDRRPNQLLVNESRLAESWVEIRLRGRRTNRFGIGARLRVTAVGADGQEIVRFARISQGTGFGSAPYLAHVGLLDAVEVREVRVDWPVSGCRGSYHAALDARTVLDEEDCLRARTALPDEAHHPLTDSRIP